MVVGTEEEDLVLTLIADVRYIFNSSTAQPVHQRFDGKSHVCLFENALKRRARIEIVNQTRTPNEDAVDGYLDEVRVHYSFRHPTLICFTVGQTEGNEWQLTSFDLKNEHKHLFKLQSVDIYFWTNNDAIQVVNAIRRLLSPEQITILDEPIPTPSHYIQRYGNPFIQKPENVDINNQLNRQNQLKNSVSSLPGPPISATPNVRQFISYTPLPYDPAAPPAPEKITYREKTPPIDDGGINPLRAVIASELALSLQEMSEPVPQNNSLNTSCPPPVMSTCYSSNSQNVLETRSFDTLHISSPPNSSTPVHNSTYKYEAQSSVFKPNHSNVPVTQYANYPTSPGVPHIMNTPSIYSPEYSTPVLTPVNNSKYEYTSTSNNSVSLKTTELSTNQLINKAVEAETIPKSSKQFKATVGRFEERAARLERGVGSLLKKLEKKIG